MKSFKKSSIKLTASVNAVIAQFHQLPNKGRVENIVKRVETMNENAIRLKSNNDSSVTTARVIVTQAQRKE